VKNKRFNKAKEGSLMEKKDRKRKGEKQDEKKKG